MSKELTREELWDAGVQYGHQTKRWNPKMKPYIYGVKNKNHIIDLQQTMDALTEVKKVVADMATKGGKILFVGTKRSAKPAMKEAALRSQNFYVNSRWLGGTLTNMKTISHRIKTLWNIEQEEKSGQLALRPKKEQVLILKEKAKLEKNLGGIKQMHKLPAALFVADPKTDEIAVKEARKLGIPVIAICDTNADPDLVDYVIPGNDDLMESINILTNDIVDAYAEAANIKMAPSVLRTKIVKRERTEGDNRRPYNNNRGDRKPFNRDNNGEKRTFNRDNNGEKRTYVKRTDRTDAPKTENKTEETK
ncbi:30S ribosomal protein S2 [Mesoplasma lactucae]|uniref:Small ribosomal subunit protein uS2 n=1 Tax=Mesoplasma lactucae ATCC 49193 TaxID=81460 RepID=A0A291IR66_9MOLU|nr:30S ribosomal protein S2 [Mesoplasma lactucae]ATG97263.1 30S ribosomal protein S2 [Mesoplasma lactucae ATCC 49193]ATZ20288.1 30S ribosomal protein S2 [Mesoplasma lactucae ATCC 49193]MCL8216459.1 hypothetical protein [Mesoplasma lactucae ATCC 49193]